MHQPADRRTAVPGREDRKELRIRSAHQTRHATADTGGGVRSNPAQANRRHASESPVKLPTGAEFSAPTTPVGGGISDRCGVLGTREAEPLGRISDRCGVRDSRLPLSRWLLSDRIPYRRRKYPVRFESNKANAATMSATAMASLRLVTAR